MLSKTEKDIEINIREVYRYLGYGKNMPNEDMIDIINACIKDVMIHSDLRFVKERFPFRESETEGKIFIGDLKLNSKNLAKNLRGCEEVILMGATIGVGVDRLIARASITDVTKAAIYQAIGAAYIEDYCDYINNEIIAIACKEGCETRPRYSPGYGDLSLGYQEDIARLLNLSKNVGISLNESKIMSPSKSVTAIIGLKKMDEAMDNPENTIRKATEKCRFCDMRNCPYRIV